ncbi:MAG TPA: hypothetical protein DGT21_17685 [Armatimonadetes bacterium]|jgi:uncharacterized protein (DUF3084 family)|nr:hypothetical protein [Armatimonadota bacterium]
MSPNAIIAFLVLPLAGALIAWAGDVIGYRLGKRRVSLFGLRPRSTARLIGLLFGAGLPVLGLLVAMAFVPDARKAIFQLDAMEEQIDSLTALRDQLSDANAALQKRRDELSDEVGEVRAQSEDLQRQIQALGERSRTLESEVAQLEKARAELSARVAKSESQYKAAETRLREKEADLKDTREKLAGAQGSLTEATQALEAQHARASELDEKNRALEATKARLDAQVDGLKQQVAGLEADVGKAEDELAKLNKELEGLKTELAQKQSEIDAKLTEIERLKGQMERLAAEYDQYRRRQTGIAASAVVYEAGDVLVRVKARTDETDEDFSRWLVELLEFASVAAERRGAVRGLNGRAVLLVAPVPPEIIDRPVTELDSVEYLTKTIRSFPVIEEWVVSVTVFRRFVKGETGQVHVRMIAQPNERVFVQDEVIAETVVPAGSEAADVFTALWVLLRGGVRQEAIRRNMLPEPDSGQYGAVDSRELFEVIEEIEDLEYNVRVQVVPIRDTYTADQMKVKFVIHREPQAPADAR